MIVCRDVEASDGVSIRTLVESCIRVKRFPQADVGLNPKENAVLQHFGYNACTLFQILCSPRIANRNI